MACAFGGKQKTLCDNVKCNVCREKSFESSENSPFWSDKNKLKPRQVSKFSHAKFLFKCEKCGHEFEKVLYKVSKGAFCSYCCNRILCDDNNCQVCFNKTVASHERANKCWSDKNDILPRQVFKTSFPKYWFNCNNCGHEFQLAPRQLLMESWCPFCCYPPQRLCSDEGCEDCKNKSFASSNRVSCWSAKNEINPRDVFISARIACWFDCDKCCHDFLLSLGYVSKGQWCPYCSNYILCKNNNCDECFQKSLASHKRIACWSPKNTVLPREISKHWSTKYYFVCDKCQREFQVSPSRMSQGCWCPFCRNKTETKLKDWLFSKFDYYTIIYQAKFDWCRNKLTNYKLSYDFYIKDLNLIIELDGLQHFKQVNIWHGDLKIRMERDIYKMLFCFQQNISMVRIRQEDVWFDRNDWEDKLLNAIHKYEQHTITYLDDTGIYNLHDEEFEKLKKIDLNSIEIDEHSNESSELNEINETPKKIIKLKIK